MSSASSTVSHGRTTLSDFSDDDAEFSSSRSSSKSSCCLWSLVIGAVLLVVSGIVVGVVIGTGTCSNKNSVSATPPPGSTAPPKTEPLRQPTAADLAHQPIDTPQPDGTSLAPRAGKNGFVIVFRPDPKAGAAPAAGSSPEYTFLVQLRGSGSRVCPNGFGALGGVVEQGENSFQAAAREAVEESGLLLKNLTKFGKESTKADWFYSVASENLDELQCAIKDAHEIGDTTALQAAHPSWNCYQPNGHCWVPLKELVANRKPLGKYYNYGSTIMWETDVSLLEYNGLQMLFGVLILTTSLFLFRVLNLFSTVRRARTIDQAGKATGAGGALTKRGKNHGPTGAAPSNAGSMSTQQKRRDPQKPSVASCSSTAGGQKASSSSANVHNAAASSANVNVHARGDLLNRPPTGGAVVRLPIFGPSEQPFKELWVPTEALVQSEPGPLWEPKALFQEALEDVLEEESTSNAETAKSAMGSAMGSPMPRPAGMRVKLPKARRKELIMTAGRQAGAQAGAQAAQS